MSAFELYNVVHVANGLRIFRIGLFRLECSERVRRGLCHPRALPLGLHVVASMVSGAYDRSKDLLALHDGRSLRGIPPPPQALGSVARAVADSRASVVVAGTASRGLPSHRSGTADVAAGPPSSLPAPPDTVSVDSHSLAGLADDRRLRRGTAPRFSGCTTAPDGSVASSWAPAHPGDAHRDTRGSFGLAASSHASSTSGVYGSSELHAAVGSQEGGSASAVPVSGDLSPATIQHRFLERALPWKKDCSQIAPLPRGDLQELECMVCGVWRSTHRNRDKFSTYMGKYYDREFPVCRLCCDATDLVVPRDRAHFTCGGCKHEKAWYFFPLKLAPRRAWMPEGTPDWCHTCISKQLKSGARQHTQHHILAAPPSASAASDSQMDMCHPDVLRAIGICGDYYDRLKSARPGDNLRKLERGMPPLPDDVLSGPCKQAFQMLFAKSLEP